MTANKSYPAKPGEGSLLQSRSENRDRTVHGRSMNYTDPWEIVRYDRTGKWYLEAEDGRRVHVGVRHAARVAADGEFSPGLPGGRVFDRIVREKRAEAARG